MLSRISRSRPYHIAQFNHRLMSTIASTIAHDWSTNKMTTLLYEHNFDTRDKLKELAKDPLFVPRYNISLKDERQLAYDRLKKVCSLGIVSVKDFLTNPRNIFAVHEMLGMIDGSLCTKFTVQFNLFARTLFKLGTLHHHLINDIDTLKLVGCFALTELGYGNNAVEMETTAFYDKLHNQFIIDSPTTMSQKYWITNGAIHAHYAIVFAKLYMPKVKNNNNDDCKHTFEGIHAFLVPIRDESMNVKEGVKIWDMGRKIGLNGIDNAALRFNNVRVPVDNLLNAYSKVTNGIFSSTIEDNSNRKRERFVEIIGQLDSGRICITNMMLGSTKNVLDATIKYANSRLAVDKKGYSTSPILDFQAHQNKLMPLIAKTYALNFCSNYVQSVYATVSGAKDPLQVLTRNQSEELNNFLTKLCCMIKPLVTWHALEVATSCRQLCGGQGYLEVNRFGEAIAGAHAGITAEGDNVVMQQKVAKEILDEFAKLTKTTSSIKLGFEMMRDTMSFSSYHFADLTTPVNINKLLKNREDVLKYTLAFKLRGIKGEKLYDEWMHNQSNLIQDLAVAFSHRVTSEQFLKVLDGSGVGGSMCPDEVKPVLTDLYKLYGMCEIKRDAAFYLTRNFMSNKQYNHIDTSIQQLCKSLSSQADKLTTSFGIVMHHSPMVTGLEKYNETENNGELMTI